MSDTTTETFLNIRFFTNYSTCNFKCPYCVAQKNAANKKNLVWDDQKYTKIIDNILRLPYRINLRLGVAGEFFLCNTLIQSAEMISHHADINSLNIITNLSFHPKKYDEILKNFDKSKIGIVASYHPTEIKDFNQWLDSARYMAQNIDFIICVVAVPDKLDSLIQTINLFKQNGIDVFIQPLHGSHNGKKYPESYTEQELEKIKPYCYSSHDFEYGFLLKRPELCEAGFSSIFIDINGEVYRCGSYRAHNTIIGNMLEGTLNLEKTASLCDFDKCLCDTENMNIVSFKNCYIHTGKNQHKYRLKNR